MVEACPAEYKGVLPYLYVSDGAAAIDFYVKAFGATEKVRMPGPDGKVGHAEINLAGSVVMIASEYPDCGAISPRTTGSCPVGLVFYVEDVDAVFNKALQFGATVEEAVADKFYGDRMGTLIDPFGYRWSIGTHIKDVSPEELERLSRECAEGAEAGAK